MTQGHLSVVLHAHLPFVRHPEHERFLEETWLFEAVTESYVPLLQVMDRWQQDGMRTRLTLTLTPVLCSLLRDPLLQERYVRHLNGLIDLVEKEILRTHWDRAYHVLAEHYHRRFLEIRDFYERCGRDLVGAFGRFQQAGRLEIITSAATHALLPLLGRHGPSLRGQILTARDHYRSCFGSDPRGIWLPECAYAGGVDAALREAGLRWFIVDTHGILHANPPPQMGTFAPIITPAGLAAFGRDRASARQVWSRHEGYPGNPCYRDFYRDIGFDLDLEYLKTYLLDSSIIGSPAARSRKRFMNGKPRFASPMNTRHIFYRRVGPKSRRPPRCSAGRRWCWRPTMPSCSGTGGMKARNSWICSCAKRRATRRCSH
jgi:1,4-alpha-glucan branching enzyme